MTNNSVFSEHPEPIASTSTPYDDDENDEEQEETTKISLEDYFEIIMMTSPVAGIKYYLPRHQATNQHALIIQTPKQEATP